MSTIVERMAARHRTILFGSLIGFALWQGAQLARQVSPSDGPPPMVFVAVELAGGLIWTLFLIRVIAFDRGVPVAVRDVLNDELTTHRRGTSFMVGLIAVSVAQMVLLALGVANPGIRLAAQFTIFVAVIATIGSYLYLDRE